MWKGSIFVFNQYIQYLFKFYQTYKKNIKTIDSLYFYPVKLIKLAFNHRNSLISR